MQFVDFCDELGDIDFERLHVLDAVKRELSSQANLIKPNLIEVVRRDLDLLVVELYEARSILTRSIVYKRVDYWSTSSCVSCQQSQVVCHILVELLLDLVYINHHVFRNVCVLQSHLLTEVALQDLDLPVLHKDSRDELRIEDDVCGLGQAHHFAALLGVVFPKSEERFVKRLNYCFRAFLSADLVYKLECRVPV